ncbi:MAG: nucleotidyl transferase AbiEii/AbiGii toxin family protein [Flavobacteriales bacterium]|nr:nucleotidyl transferase AbiEii/AbiGii toxin family protein [Flavobacteriales bacterium]
MITLDEIRAGYPPELQDRASFLLREYLQYRILQIIYRTDQARKLVFLGGTCLRLIHHNRRFSEDLDFDNLGLSKDQFTELAQQVGSGLEREGYNVNVQVRSKTAFRCKVRFPGLVFRHGLSGHVEQSVLIQFDTEPQHFDYEPELRRLDRFDVSFSLPCCPPSLLLAQKCHAILGRPRNKGRDFFDVVFLLARNVRPDLNYLREKVGVPSIQVAAEKLIAHCSTLDMKQQAEDVRPFLFDAPLADTVINFTAIIRQHWLPQ